MSSNMMYNAVDGNGMMVQRELPIVGWIAIPENYIHTRYYECPAWYTHIQLTPGSYPILDHGVDYPFSAGHCRYRISVPGKVAGSNFTARIGAVFGNPRIDEYVGKDDVAIISWPDYMFAEMAFNKMNNIGTIHLVDGYESVSVSKEEDSIKYFNLRQKV